MPKDKEDFGLPPPYSEIDPQTTGKSQWSNQKPNQAPSQPQGSAGSYGSYGSSSNTSGYISGYTPKRALLVGMGNYGGMNGSEDVRRMQTLLVQRGYKPENISVLTDTHGNPPTKKNMIVGMQWLVEGARPGESFVFLFSGKGGEQLDGMSDSTNGYEDTICPIDYQRKGMISDDLIHTFLVKPLPHGSRLTAFLNCNYSGGALGLPYVYSATKNGDFQTQDYLKQSEASAIQFTRATLSLNAGQIIQGARKLAKVATRDAITSTNADVVVISGRKGWRQMLQAPKTINKHDRTGVLYSFVSSPLSVLQSKGQADTPEVLCRVLLDVLERQPGVSYRALLQQIRQSQRVQLSSSYRRDLDGHIAL